VYFIMVYIPLKIDGIKMWKKEDKQRSRS
jgi:hypothetical protein